VKDYKGWQYHNGNSVHHVQFEFQQNGSFGIVQGIVVGDVFGARAIYTAMKGTIYAPVELEVNKKHAIYADHDEGLPYREVVGVRVFFRDRKDQWAAYQDWTIQSEDFHKYLTGVNIVEFDEQARRDEDLYH
jgi:hypothetical protein